MCELGGVGWWGGWGPDLHDKHPDSIGSSLAQLQRLGGAHHNVDDGDHKPGQNEEGHQPVDVLHLLPSRKRHNTSFMQPEYDTAAHTATGWSLP